MYSINICTYSPNLRKLKYERNIRNHSKHQKCISYVCESILIKFEYFMETNMSKAVKNYEFLN